MPNYQSTEYEDWKKSMTNYQYDHLMALIEKVNRLAQENEALYQLVKGSAEAGKSSEEILTAVESFRENPSAVSSLMSVQKSL